MKTATIKCSECTYTTKSHYSLKGAIREVRKANDIYSGATLCPQCKKAQTLLVIVSEEDKA